MRASAEMVTLAAERLQYWSQLRQLAGIEVSATVRDLMSGSMEAEFESRLVTLRAEYDAKLEDLKRSYPQQIARRLVEGLMQRGGSAMVADLVATLPAVVAEATTPAGNGAVAVAQAAPAAATAPAAPAAKPAPAPKPAAAAAAAAATGGDDALVMEAYIDSERCTTCNECTNLNKKMFTYNDAKQAVIKDPKAGTFQQLVLAAERCPVAIIHPGTPLNPHEKDLAKWVKRAEKFN